MSVDDWVYRLVFNGAKVCKVCGREKEVRYYVLTKNAGHYYV